MSGAETFWTVLVFILALIIAIVFMGWAWYWALLTAWIAVGVAASLMGVK